jgi:fumarate reductase subunit C
LFYKIKERKGIQFLHLKKILFLRQVWWCILVILALGKLREEDRKFEASLDYKARPCLRKKRNEKKKKKKKKSMKIVY